MLVAGGVALSVRFLRQWVSSSLTVLCCFVLLGAGSYPWKPLQAVVESIRGVAHWWNFKEACVAKKSTLGRVRVRDGGRRLVASQNAERRVSIVWGINQNQDERTPLKEVKSSLFNLWLIVNIENYFAMIYEYSLFFWVRSILNILYLYLSLKIIPPKTLIFFANENWIIFSFLCFRTLILTKTQKTGV